MKPLALDSSPLTHFARAGRLAALDRLTGNYRRVVPRAVLDEIQAGEGQYPPLADVRNAEWLVDQLREAEAWLPCTGAEFVSWAKDRGLLP